MRIVVAFHDLQACEASDLGDAFWLADTPINRACAEEAWATDRVHRNSAIFHWTSGAVEVDDILERLDDVDLHHPNWCEIWFLAIPLTNELQARIQCRGVLVERSPNGFSVKRQSNSTTFNGF